VHHCRKSVSPSMREPSGVRLAAELAVACLIVMGFEAGPKEIPRSTLASIMELCLGTNTLFLTCSLERARHGVSTHASSNVFILNHFGVHEARKLGVWSQ
jgi:hypothetical protein